MTPSFLFPLKDPLEVAAMDMFDAKPKEQDSASPGKIFIGAHGHEPLANGSESGGGEDATNYKALCGFVSMEELKDVIATVPEIADLVGGEDATKVMNIEGKMRSFEPLSFSNDTSLLLKPPDPSESLPLRPRQPPDHPPPTNSSEASASSTSSSPLIFPCTTSPSPAAAATPTPNPPPQKPPPKPPPQQLPMINHPPKPPPQTPPMKPNPPITTTGTANAESTLDSIDVLACVIEPSVSSKHVKELNQIWPQENLGQIKRIARYAASSKEGWEEHCKLWPTSYHPPNSNSNMETRTIMDELRSLGKKWLFDLGQPLLNRVVCPHPELVGGLRSHTEGVILLFQDDEVSGFQVLKNGVSGFQVLKNGEWIDVQPLPNSVVLTVHPIGPDRKWKGPWRWFDKAMRDSCVPWKKVNPKGNYNNHSHINLQIKVFDRGRINIAALHVFDAMLEWTCCLYYNS